MEYDLAPYCVSVWAEPGRVEIDSRTPLRIVPARQNYFAARGDGAAHDLHRGVIDFGDFAS